jgi:Rod binding domain-containing protein
MISPIISGLQQSARQQPASTSHQMSGPQLDKLRKGAREFESMMVEQIWKGMKTESDDSGSGHSLSDMASHAFAVGVAARGGFGIAKMILHQLAPSANSAAPELKLGEPSADPLGGD